MYAYRYQSLCTFFTFNIFPWRCPWSIWKWPNYLTLISLEQLEETYCTWCSHVIIQSALRLQWLSLHSIKPLHFHVGFHGKISCHSSLLAGFLLLSFLKNNITIKRKRFETVDEIKEIKLITMSKMNLVHCF